MQNKLMPYSLLFTIVLLPLLSLFWLITASRCPPYPNDDAYTTLTYAKNLARGNGFVLHYPCAVLRTTTSLFTLAYLLDFDRPLASIRSDPCFMQNNQLPPYLGPGKLISLYTNALKG